MRADISPNRISISDRYPMLGFTIRSFGGQQQAEVTLATDPALFNNPEGRTPDNFFSTASMGPLPIVEDEAVYIVPAEVLARFVGKDRLYFALATKPMENGSAYHVHVHPNEDSVYISLAGLTGRSLRRVRMFPNRSAVAIPGYGADGNAQLSWAGDTAQPGTQATSPAPTPVRSGTGAPEQESAGRENDAAPREATPAPYDDGFGDLPPLTSDAPSDPVVEDDLDEEGDLDDAEDLTDDTDTSEEAIEDAAIAASLGVTTPAVRDIEIEDRVRATAPSSSSMGTALRLAFEAMMVSNPALSAMVAAARLANLQGLSVGIGPAVSGGFAGGGSLGAGIILAPDNEFGVYGVAEIDLGAIFSLSATIQMTVLEGGISAFEGITYVAGFSAGEGIVGGGTVIFDEQSNFMGVSVEIGLGIGSPLDVYAGVQRGVAQELGYATAFGHEPALAEPMGRDGATEAGRYVPRWRHLIRWRTPSAVVSALRRRRMSVQTFGSARGDLNVDLLEVRINRLPSGQTAEDLIRHIRVNLPRFVDPSVTDFKFYAASDRSKWSGSNPVGTVFNLDIPGDDAAVVASMVTSRKWRFTTLEAPATGTHPVSGHREFGIREADGGYIIYTRGADRFTYHSVGGVLETGAFWAGERLWKSFQRKVADHVNRNGGRARVLTPFRKHFSWANATAALSRSSGSSARGARPSPAQALGAGSDPYTVEVKYRMFIPSPAITGPSDDYGGDGRGFSYSSGTSRGEITARVTLTRGMGIERVRIVDRHWGESTAYDSDDTFAVSGKPDWWLNKRSGAQPTDRATLRATDDNLNVETGTSGRRAIHATLENASVVSVKAAGALPLSRIAPDIDADVAIFFRKHNGEIQVKAVGQHDGFPAHELYVNRKSIYRFDPVAADSGPTALVGWEDTELDTRWVTVARPGSGAQALGLNESFTSNWDDVQRIAQPTNLSCWAAAAAMIVGWRDQMSLSPAVIAEIANRPIQKGLNVNDIDDLAKALDLEAVAGQSFTKQGFRDLLEDNGPLWVGVAVPSLHAVVVTGLYTEGEDLYVRITDPWDRVVGTPGSPGSYASTHATGSRYIMTWDAFVDEYELAATSAPGATFQILHAKGSHGHRLNRGETAPPEGYAASLAAAPSANGGSPAPAGPPPAAAVPEVSISKDAAPIGKVVLVPVSGPNGVPTATRWTTAISETLGAEHAAGLASIPGLAADRGWTIAIGRDSETGYAAPGVGVAPGGTIFRYGDAVAAPMSAAAGNGSGRLLVTIAEGEPELFTRWSKARSFAMSGDVTGAILFDEADMPLAIAARLMPGATLPQHIEAVAQAVTAAYGPGNAGAPSGAAPSAVVAPDTASDVTSAPVAAPPPAAAAPQAPVDAPVAASALTSMLEAAGASPAVSGAVPATPPAIPTPVGGDGAALMPPMPAPDGDFPPPDVTIHRSEIERSGVHYALFLMDGKVMPETPTQAVQPLLPGAQVVVDSWPYIDGAGGRSKGGVVVDWSHGGGAVGNVRTAPAAPSTHDGWSIQVTTDVGPGPSEAEETKLLVTIRTVFTKDGEDTRTGVSHVTLCGSGKHDLHHADETRNAEPAIA